MRVFVLPDLHGRAPAMLALLRAAGVIDADGRRLTEDLVVQVGDLINGTMMDWDADTEILKKAEGLVDFWVLGNHDAAYDYPHLSFQGFAPSPSVRSGINRWLGSGRLVPAVVVGDTLITHAGVHEDFDFGTARDAFLAIEDVYEKYSLYSFIRVGGGSYSKDEFTFKHRGGESRVPKGMLLDGLPTSRGGRSPRGGLLWADWDEPKNTRFSQVVGHTIVEEGPVLTQYLNSGVFTLNIDAGAKKGRGPVGVWLDEDGQIIDFVELEADDDERQE